MAIDTSTGSATVVVSDTVTDSKVTVNVAVPVATPQTRPGALTSITVWSDEVQVDMAVMSSEVPSLNVPVATNERNVARGIDAEAGVMVMLVTVALVTTSVAEAETPPERAVMTVVPAETPTASPVLLTVATPGFEEVQLTELVRYCEVLSVNLPRATNASVVFFAICAVAGLRVIETSAGGATVTVVEP
jgi:hypothetical protein